MMMTSLTSPSEADAPFSPGQFAKNLIALGSIFWAGYLWLVLAA